MKDFKLAVRFVFPYWKKYWKYEVGLISLLAVRFAAQMGVPIAFKYVTDSIVTAKMGRYFVVALAAFCALVFLTIVVSWGFRVLATWVGESLNIDITSSVYGHVLKQRRSFWERFYPNDVLTRLTQDILSVKSFTFDIAHNLLLQGAVVLGTVVILLTMSKDVGLLMAGYIPIVFIVTYAGNVFLQKNAARLRTLSSSFTQVFNHSIQQPWLTFSWGLFPYHYENYRDLAFRRKKEQVLYINRVQFINGALSLLNLLIGSAAVFWVLRSSYQARLITTGTLFALVMYAGQATQSTVGLAATLIAGKLNRMSILRIVELTSIDNGSVSAFDPFGETMLHPHFKGSLGDGIKLPENGPFPYFLSAENGAGKTTYTNTLSGFDDLGGKVALQNWYVIPANPMLFRGPLIGNIRIISGRDVTDAEVLDILKQNRMEQLLSVFHEGFSTAIAENSDKASQGQKQAAVLISAIVRDPENVVLDEGVNSLEGRLKEEIGDGLITWLSERRSVVIEHDGYLSSRASFVRDRETKVGVG